MSLPRAVALAVLLALAAPAWSADDAVVAGLNARLGALDNDPQLREQGAYERLQALQAIARYADSSRGERDSALYVAQRRVEIAELAARTAADNRKAAELEQARNALLLEASRRETARVRQEAERLRVQQQIQAEEVERVRQQAEAEAAAQVEQVMTTATGAQQAKLTAARQKDASLARQEAELVSGAKLPRSTFSAGGAETFALPASVFEAGKTTLSGEGQSAVRALAAYLDATPRARLRVDGYGDPQTPGARRSAALREALIAAGAPQAKVSDGGDKGTGTPKRAAAVVFTL